MRSVRVCSQSENMCFESLMKSLFIQPIVVMSELKIHYNASSQSPTKETKRKVLQLNYILSFIFNFVLHIIYIATFQNSVA